MTRLQQTLLLIAVSLFAVAPLIVRAFSSDQRLPTPEQAIFFGLATLPGLVGLVNYISSQRTRFELQKDAVKNLKHVTRDSHANYADTEKFEPSFVAWLTGSLLLTGVFLIVAVLARFANNSNPPVEGIVFAGYGTYVATLWFMLGRLNAHALSPRFLVNSALKAAMAMLIGFIAATSISFFKPAEGTSTQLLLFMIGFFHEWALGYVRKKAVEMFQANQNAAPDLPLGMVEGVDDAAADLLDELGISSVQHLATQNPIELSMRSLYPIRRVTDWVDQALLTLFFRDKIAAGRELGIRGMTDFTAVYNMIDGADQKKAAQSKELMSALAQKLGMSESALFLMADACRRDDSVKFICNLRHLEEHDERARAETAKSTTGTVVKPSADASYNLPPEMQQAAAENQIHLAATESKPVAAELPAGVANDGKDKDKTARQ